jgi:hypothetical protein
VSTLPLGRGDPGALYVAVAGPDQFPSSPQQRRLSLQTVGGAGTHRPASRTCEPDAVAYVVAVEAGTSMYVAVAPQCEHLKSIEVISCGAELTCASEGLSSAATSW